MKIRNNSTLPHRPNEKTTAVEIAAKIVRVHSQKATDLIVSQFYRLVATCHLQTCYNLFKKIVASLCIINFDNQLATNLLITSNRLVINKLLQAMRTQILILACCNKLLQNVNRRCKRRRLPLILIYILHRDS